MPRLAIALLLLPVLALAGEWRESHLSFGGRERAYRVYTPEGAKPDSPVIVLLHGGSGSMRRISGPKGGAWLAWQTVADREHLTLLAPNGLSRFDGNGLDDTQQWNDLRPTGPAARWGADDTAFILACLDAMRPDHPPSPERTFVFGISNGGMMTLRLLMEKPERFAAGAAFVATLPVELQKLPATATPRPLLISLGTKDPIVPWAGGGIPADGTPMRSAEATLDFWIEHNRADRVSPVTVVLPDRDVNDGCRASRTVYPGKPHGAPVEFLKVEGGGHLVPTLAHPAPGGALARSFFGAECHDFETAEAAAEFFARASREKPPAKPTL